MWCSVEEMGRLYYGRGGGHARGPARDGMGWTLPPPSSLIIFLFSCLLMFWVVVVWFLVFLALLCVCEVVGLMLQASGYVVFHK